ncbi:MAG: hypothetical protein ACLRZ6_12145 [Lachnospiraceae bacterium]
MTVRAPMYAPQSDIERILREKKAGYKSISRKSESRKQEEENAGREDEYESVESEYLTNEEIKLADKALQHIQASKLLCKADHVTYGKLTIAIKRQDSCSSKEILILIAC